MLPGATADWRGAREEANFPEMATATWLTGPRVRKTPRGTTWMLIPTFLLILGTSGVVNAQGPAQGSEEAAVTEYQAGRAHFEAGRYRDAIVHLERAVSLDPNSPTLVYNVARVYELLGELDDAIRYYHMFLRMLGPDDADERSRVADTIGRLEGAQREAEENAPPPPEEDARLDRPVLVEEHGVADLAFWLTAGGSAVLLATGGILGALALMQKNSADCTVGDQCTLDERDDAATSAQNLALGADILLITGGVAALSAVLLYFLRTRTVETYPQYEGTTAFFGTDGQGALAGLRGTF